MMRAGSPGMKKVTRKTRIEMPMRVGMTLRTRRAK
jgi:hypothetical protein